MAGFLSNRYIPEGCIEEIKDIRDNEIEFENGSLLVYSIGLKNIDDGDFDAIIIADWDTKVGKYYYEIGGLSGADAVISISDSLTEYMSGNNPNGVRDFLGEFSVNSV